MALKTRMMMSVTGLRMNERVRTSKRWRGFSILEILIVVGIAALIFVLTLPTLRGLSRVELKSSSGQFLGLIRDVYSRAALAGQSYRIVFDLDNNTYWVEKSSDDVRVFSNEEEEKKAAEAEENGLRFMDQADREKKKYLKKPEFSPLDDALGEKHKLPNKVRIYGVWTQGMSEWARSGTHWLYFFPTGYTQKAQISLTDDAEGKHLLVLVVKPLTGEVVIEHEEMPIK